MAFKMNDKLFPSMLAIAKELGKSRIYRKDFDKLGIVEVDDNEIEEVKAETPVVEETKEETKPEPEVAEVENKEVPEVPVEEETLEVEVKAEEKPETKEPIKEEKKPRRAKLTDAEKEARRAKRKEEKRLAKEEAKKPTPEMLAKAEELQAKSGYTDIWDWAVDMKKKTADEVFELAKGLDITWERHDVARIDRMHAVMALRENLFPGQKRPKVRRSPWNGVANEAIAGICKDKNIEYAVTADEKITRMHMIKALGDAGIKTPEDAGIVSPAN